MKTKNQSSLLSTKEFVKKKLEGIEIRKITLFPIDFYIICTARHFCVQILLFSLNKERSAVARRLMICSTQPTLTQLELFERIKNVHRNS